MVIKINNSVLDFQLENEKTAYDVINAINNYLKENNLIISGIKINNKEYFFDDKKLKNIDIDRIIELDIEASSIEELINSLICEIENIFNNIISDLQINKWKHCKEFIELLNWVLETFDAIKLHINQYISEIIIAENSVTRIIEYLQKDDKNDKDINLIVNILSYLISYINILSDKIFAKNIISKNEIEKSIDEITSFLPEIPELFHAGKDNQALLKINKIINLLELCIIYIKQNINNFTNDKKNNIEKLYNDINLVLNNLLTAFENNDIVLIGDILEYELGEKLNNYKDIVLLN